MPNFFLSYALTVSRVSCLLSIRISIGRISLTPLMLKEALIGLALRVELLNPAKARPLDCF